MSQCVSIGFTQIGKKKITLDFWPSNNDGDDDVCVNLISSADEFAARIKDCKTIEELRQELLNELDLYSLFSCDVGDEDMPTSEFINELKNADDYYEDLAAEVTRKYNAFKAALNGVTNLDEIESVSINEFFSGCGEFMMDEFLEFHNTIVPDTSEFEYEEDDEIIVDITSALLEKFTEAEVKSMDLIGTGEACNFEANINTSINIKTKEVTKNYSFRCD